MSNSKRLRWGLLSTARINQAVITPIRASKKSELLAVASRSIEKGSEYASSQAIPRYYSAYDDLLADPQIDVIYISLPNSLHAEWSIKAMQMGKHVLCEKPLAVSTGEVDEVNKVATKMGKVITEAFMYRHHPQSLYVKRLVEDGEIGNLQMIRGTFCYFNTRPNDIRLDPALGGGSLWDIGIYPISYARFITGAVPLEVFGHQVIGPTGVDLLFAGQMRFPNEVITQFNCSFITDRKAEIEIIGDKGSIYIPEPYKPGKTTRINYQSDNQDKTITIKGQELYQGEIEDIEDAILEGKPVRINLDDSRGNIATIEALYQSANLSRPVAIQN